jgi:hypothetical protein
LHLKAALRRRCIPFSWIFGGRVSCLARMEKDSILEAKHVGGFFGNRMGAGQN